MNFLLKKSHQITSFPQALYNLIHSTFEIRLMNPILPSHLPPLSLVELLGEANRTMTPSGFLNSFQEAQMI